MSVSGCFRLRFMTSIRPQSLFCIEREDMTGLVAGGARCCRKNDFFAWAVDASPRFLPATQQNPKRSCNSNVVGIIPMVIELFDA